MHERYKSSMHVDSWGESWLEKSTSWKESWLDKSTFLHRVMTWQVYFFMRVMAWKLYFLRWFMTWVFFLRKVMTWQVYFLSRGDLTSLFLEYRRLNKSTIWVEAWLGKSTSKGGSWLDKSTFLGESWLGKSTFWVVPAASWAGCRGLPAGWGSRRWAGYHAGHAPAYIDRYRVFIKYCVFSDF